MTAISAKDVMTLRARTNAGMMDAKKALQEADGDMEKAGDLLRQWGRGRAAVRTSMEMKEGLIGGRISADGKLGVLVRLGCQTDFVARNDAFVKLLNDLVQLALANAVLTPAELNRLAWPDGSGRTVEAVIKELAGGAIKENLAVTGLARFQTSHGQVGSYVHHNAKVGCLVQVDGAAHAAVRVLISEVAMHITAGVPFVPLAISREQVEPAVVEKERRLAAEAITGKPPAIVEKIVTGKVEKFFADQVLLEQPFVKDEKRKISDLLAATSAAVGAKLQIARFARFKVGEV